MNQVLTYVATAAAGYLLGSISTGLIVAQSSSNVDLRKEGSKSTGATNVMRVLGKKPAAITFIGDFLKVFIACAIGSLLSGHNGAMIAGLAGIIGHNWPVYYQFKGGKGVAGSVAVMLYLYPVPAFIAISSFFIVLSVTKFVSLGSMIMLTLFSLIVIAMNFSNIFTILWAITIAGLCIYRHRANIDRLIMGTENKTTFKSKK